MIYKSVGILHVTSCTCVQYRSVLYMCVQIYRCYYSVQKKMRAWN